MSTSDLVKKSGVWCNVHTKMTVSTMDDFTRKRSSWTCIIFDVVVAAVPRAGRVVLVIFFSVL